MRKQFAVLGLGRFGSNLAIALAKMGHEVLVVDSNEEHINKISEYVTQAVQADVQNEDTLRELGLRNFDSVIVAIGDDIQASILVVVILKELGVKQIVAKAQSELHGKVLEKIGADKVIYPERDMAVRVAHCLTSSNFIEQIHLSNNYSLVELKASPKISGKTLGQINFRAKYGINILAVKKAAAIIVSPGADAVLEENDILVALGHIKAIDKLDKFLM